MTTTKSTHFADAIARYQKRVEAIQRIQGLMDSDPEFLPELLKLLGANGQASTIVSGHAEEAPLTHLERIRAFFGERNNKWASTREILTATGIKRGSLGVVLYQGKGATFDVRRHPTSKKLRQWRLKLKDRTT